MCEQKKARIADRKIIPDLKEAEKKILNEHRIVSLFIDNAKTYIQLSTGALVLSVTFIEKAGNNNSFPINGFIVASWFFWLVSILIGALYQYVAIKYLETMENDHDFLFYDREWKIIIPKVILNNPYSLYAVMVLFFYIGAVSFAISAMEDLKEVEGIFQ